MSNTRPTNGKAASAGWDAIARHYEARLAEHGLTPRGVDWPNGSDLATRFGVMLGIVPDSPELPALLDLGCGTGFLLDYMTAMGMADRVRYQGIDLSSAMIEAATGRWPGYDFVRQDILAAPLPDRSVDVVVMNGVLTERVSLPVDVMTELAEALVAAAFRIARIGIAFNVMSAHVDWQRDDLFHWPFDSLAAFLNRNVSRHYAFRADYGLYEYTCLVWREPRRPQPPPNERWWER
jgi:SAM-dependent methyltransferase